VTTDPERARLDAAVKANDGFFTTFFVSPYSKYVARWAAHRGLRPNQVTAFSLFLGAVAAAAFATGHRGGLIAGALLLQVAFTSDCVDGQLARYTQNFSAFGAWLDATFDRLKEYLVYAGLGIGAARAGAPIWALAGAALTLQTARHMVVFSWVPPEPPAPPERGARVGAAGWLKRMAVFPIGERFAAISLTAALFTPRTTFIVLLAWGGFAALYEVAGRVNRANRVVPETTPFAQRGRSA
jgi:phosphatidylglycerophosphate synthase